MDQPKNMFISKLVATVLIDRGYLRRKHEGLEKLRTDHWVIDQRSGGVQGPFPTCEDACNLAASLNDFVRRNAGITTCPFAAFDCDGDQVVPKS